jgi:hypothetical protein
LLRRIVSIFSASVFAASYSAVLLCENIRMDSLVKVLMLSFCLKM